MRCAGMDWEIKRIHVSGIGVIRKVGFTDETGKFEEICQTDSEPYAQLIYWALLAQTTPEDVAWFNENGFPDFPGCG